MGKPFSSSSILLYIVFALFVVYECSVMFAGIDQMGDEVSAFGTISTFPILLLLFSVLYISSYKKKQKDKIYDSFVLFFAITYLLTLFWALFYPLSSRIVLFSSFLPICFWLIGDSLCTYKKEFTLKVLIPVSYIVLSAYFFLNFNPALMLDKEYAAINGSYIIIYLVPFLLLSDKRLIRIGAIILAIVITVFSLKRGGMLSLAIGVFLYLIVYGKIKSGHLLSLKGVIIAVIAIGAITYLVLYFNDSMDGLLFNRFTSIEQDGGSGRDEIYENVRKMISNSSLLGYLLGHGWGGVARDSSSGLSAHNDYLEIIYDFGIPAFLLYLLFIFRLFAHFYRMQKNNHQYAPAMAASLGIFLANSFVSHIYIYAWYFIPFTMLWGFVIRETHYLKQLKQ